VYKEVIRVVHVINSLGLGGAERFAHDLITKLDSSLFQVHVVCLYRAGVLAESLQALGVPVQVLELERQVRPKNWLVVYQVLKRLAPNLVHAHLPESCWYALPSARLAGVPVRIGHLQNVHAYWRLKLRLFDRTTSIFANKALACSEAVRHFYENEIYYPAAKLEVIYNSVNIDRFQDLPGRCEARDLLGLPQDASILICIASLEEQKGHRYLIQAMPRVQAAFPQAQLLLVGDGSLRQTLQKYVADKGLGPTVHFMGRRNDIPTLLAAGDLFVLPSLWEGLGLVLAEAGATGLPAVATHVDGIPEIIRDGVTGLLVPPANSELLAEAIIAVLHDRPRRLKMGKQARALVKEQFSMNKVADRMEGLYLSLLSKVDGLVPSSKYE
jgi:glycosyltransferase involved in cell wall biosynthesis